MANATLAAIRSCRGCHGVPKRKCMLCGRKPKRKMDMTDQEQLLYDSIVEELEYLKNTWWKLRNMNMKTTKLPELDEILKEAFGDWRL